MSTMPESGFLRIRDIVGDKKRGIPAIIPVSRSTFLKFVAEGRYPKPSKALGPRITAWSVESIRALIEAANSSGDGK